MCGIMRGMKIMSAVRKAALLLVTFASSVGVSFAEGESAAVSTSAVSPIKPAVTRDTSFVVGVNLDRSQILRAVDCFVERMLRMMEADEQTAENAALASDIENKDDPQTVLDIAKERMRLLEDGEIIFYDTTN